MMHCIPDIETFRQTAATARIIPIYRRLLSDHLTPVTAFETLSAGEHAFLLESVVGNEKIGRYSFIATSPKLIYQAHNGHAAIERSDGSPPDRFQTTDPLADLQRLMPTGRCHHDKTLPVFTGGLVGYAGYDTIRYYEGEKLPNSPADDRNLPDMLFGLYENLVIFDHVDKTIKVVANADLSDGDVDSAYRSAVGRIDELVARLQQPPPWRLGGIDTAAPLRLNFNSNMTRAQFESAVARAQEYIRAGDIFQVVPSQRLRVISPADPFDVYRALRVINPSPFMFYLKSPGCILIGASPEILCRVQDGIITSRPLAGTRPRGLTDAEDKSLEQELLADPKERAEHIMLVDLHRNDIGRVSKIGSVKLDDVMTVERYSHVMHITSNVTGQLEEGCTALDALRVSLPVGTVSGAPKIRAMQIIDELEPTRRGPYGGAVGYVDFAGNMDTCIALRTIVWQGRSGAGGAPVIHGQTTRTSQGTFDVQVGAGIVADSVPAAEYEETMSKARAMLKAVQIAQEGM